ncbi:MAG: DNA polymerase III subunit alpha, partial [Candidatus Zixiibacteriota bacterium]
DQTGYRNLIKLSTAAYLEGFYHRPRIDKELLGQYSEGLIATSACMKGEVNWLLLKGETDQAVATARELNSIFGEGNFFLEIQNHGIDKEQLLIPKVEAISRETGIPMVVTNDCHYLQQADAQAHDALLCIQTGKMVADTDRMRYNSDQIYFKSADEMKQTLGDFPEALANTVAIAEACNLEMELGKLKLPVFPLPTPFVDADSFLEHLCKQALPNKYETTTTEIEERLSYELRVIRQMGYAGYFLIVKDFCDYARTQKIPVGPGRGSAAGSLVSYLLGITSIDPIKFELLFERFLNPERISMPDIDIDFADRGRDRIIQYVIDKYGKDNVTQIITFGTMAARGVLRDVGRVLSIRYGEVDRIAKLVPERPGVTLSEALKEVSELRELRESSEQIAKLIDYALRLEGLARHCSTHAAGVVIAPSALTDYVPLFKGSKNEITTQFDMKMVEEIGLLKMDFLGLRTLTVIDDTVRMIRENHPDVALDIDNISLDDVDVYRLFSQARTIGVFQFESSGMRDYLRKLQPENFTDITAMNALYRPGPLDSGMIDTYIDCKKGKKKIKYLHPLLEQVLGATYGVIVFQEQVLKIANGLAGYTIGKADLLRKAMGKKDAALMAAQKEEFLTGAKAEGVDGKTAEKVFNQIETFARYGFNKAHSTCYAYIAYQTAWLKHYYPLEFMAALMTSEINSTDRIPFLMEECRRMGIEVLPPDVNESKTQFTVIGDKIRFGLLAIKNVGEGPAQAIVDQRHSNEKFAALADLVSREPLGGLNRRTLESLILAGACDGLEGNRAQQFAAVESTLEFGHKVGETIHSHDLFADDCGEITREAPSLDDLPEWSNSKKLVGEKAVLGVYVSGHPLDKYRNELSTFADFTAHALGSAADGREVTVGGILTAVRTNTDKKGNLYAFATIEDYTGTVELILFSDCFEKHRDLAVVDRAVLIIGRVSTREGKPPNVIVSELIGLEQVTERFQCQLVIKIGPACSDNTIERVLSSLGEYSGSTPVVLAARENGSEVYIRSKKYAVEPDFLLIDHLREILGETGVLMKPIGRK